MALDKRLPAVYVDIEDQSSVAEALEPGRSAYVVLISDRGPHNRVVELNSQQELYDLFGQPNFEKFGQGHYFANKHLERSGRIYVVRPVKTTDPDSPDNCSYVANAQLKLNDPVKDSVVVPNNVKMTIGSNYVELTSANTIPAKPETLTYDIKGYTLTEYDFINYTIDGLDKEIVLDSNIISNILGGGHVADSSSLQECTITYDITDHIITVTPKNAGVTITNATYTLTPTSKVDINADPANITAKQVTLLVDKTQISVGDVLTFPIVDTTTNISSTQKIIFNLDLVTNILGTTSTYRDGKSGIDFSFNSSNQLVLDLSPSINTQFGQYDTLTSSITLPTDTDFIFENRKDEIVKNGVIIGATPMIPGMAPADLDDFEVGDYIFPIGCPEATYEIKEINKIKAPFGILLDRPVENTSCPFTSSTTANVISGAYYGQISKYKPSTINHISRYHNQKNNDLLDPDILWNFNVIGAGKYYNSIFIKGVRNSSYDKMYTDADGNPEYPYMFMDIAIYRDNGDNTVTMLEGPWTVSLSNKTAKGVIIRDIYTGNSMYIRDVINRKSKIIQVEESRGIDNLMTPFMEQVYEPDLKKRQIIQSIISGQNQDYPDGIRMNGGTDGDMFDTMGRYIFQNVKPLLVQAYQAELESEDRSIERLKSVIYPWYQIDYIYCGGWDKNVNYAALQLAELRGDCLLLADTGTYKENHDEEIEARKNDVPWNNWNAALYVNYRQIYDEFTNQYFYVSPILHAIERHLYVDDNYWIAEPVAGIEKGAIEESVKFAYGLNETELADEIDVELNPVIVENDGTYLLQQFTTWKRLSIMKRQHVVKFIHYCKKQIPGLLKDILHRKATSYWIGLANSRLLAFMNNFVESGVSNRYVAVSGYSCSVDFDEESSELNVVLTVHPLRSIEKINVTIIVT